MTSDLEKLDDYAREEIRDKQGKLIAEHASLEKRMHNDSVIGYALLGGLLIGALSLISGAAIILVDHGVSWPIIGAVVILGFASWASLRVGRIVQNRFDNTGLIRMARAVQVEEEIEQLSLGFFGQRAFFSFRLFPPWNDWPDGYLLTLGQMKRGNLWDRSNAQAREYFESEGIRAINEVAGGLRISRLLRYFETILAIFWVALILFLIGLETGVITINIS